MFKKHSLFKTPNQEKIQAIINGSPDFVMEKIDSVDLEEFCEPSLLSDIDAISPILQRLGFQTNPASTFINIPGEKPSPPYVVKNDWKLVYTTSRMSEVYDFAFNCDQYTRRTTRVVGWRLIPPTNERHLFFYRLRNAVKLMFYLTR